MLAVPGRVVKESLFSTLRGLSVGDQRRFMQIPKNSGLGRGADLSDFENKETVLTPQALRWGPRRIRPRRGEGKVYQKKHIF